MAIDRGAEHVIRKEGARSGEERLSTMPRPTRCGRADRPGGDVGLDAGGATAPIWPKGQAVGAWTNPCRVPRLSGGPSLAGGGVRAENVVHAG
jgi:hypothetical protein